ncbi:MAG TPA: hypothetical protein PK315_09095 [Petrotogaceae bacterium]|nr:hypothetical protein [Petrotogaceae bacterium]
MKKFYVLLVFFVIFCAFTFSFGQWTPSEKEIPVLYNKLFGELKNVYTESSQNGYASKDFLDELQKAVFRQVSFNMTTPSREDIASQALSRYSVILQSIEKEKGKNSNLYILCSYIYQKYQSYGVFDLKNLSSELENNYQSISEYQNEGSSTLSVPDSPLIKQKPTAPVSQDYVSVFKKFISNMNEYSSSKLSNQTIYSQYLRQIETIVQKGWTDKSAIVFILEKLSSLTRGFKIE